MSSPEALTLLGVILVLAAVIGLLVRAMVRLRGRDRRERARKRRSERAFLAATIEPGPAERGDQAVQAVPQPLVHVVNGAVDSVIVDALPAAVLVVDEHGLVRRFNEAVSELLRVKLVAPLPAPARQLLAAHPPLVHAIDAIRTSSRASMTRIDLAEEEEWRTIELSWHPLPSDADGRRLLMVLHDVTASKAREDVARRRETMTEVAQLGSCLTHELANSLTAVHGYSRMIDASLLNPADRAALESVQKETDNLGATIEAFRRVTRPLMLTHEVFPLHRAVDDAATHVTSQTAVRSDAIARRVPETLQVHGDRLLLEEALTHLLQNSVEACQVACVEPVVVVTGEAAADGTVVHVVVSDNGPGVSEEERPQLFSLFYSTKLNHAGSGLARARHIIHSHDGTIAVSHPAGGGLKATLTLPISKTARSAVQHF
jgi:signal transduction histidine kinase